MKFETIIKENLTLTNEKIKSINSTQFSVKNNPNNKQK